MNKQHATAGAALSTSAVGLGYRDPSLARPVAERAGWQEIDVRAVDTARLLAADAVQKAGSGHPGTAMSLAPLAYLLFQNVLVHDPADEQWLGRDRFVLSAGHTSLTLYIQLFLSGYGLEIGDLEALRTWGSKTPGHPEYRHTRGVEITTGPLGQGLAAAVGMAMAARRERGLLDPEAPPRESPFDHHVYVIVSDGDMMEGISSEASSLAGHQELGSLIVFYDQNHISIEDDTDVSFSENVAARYAAYSWHVQIVDWRRQGRYTEDVDALLDAIITAKRETGRPSMIVLNTIIGWQPSASTSKTSPANSSAQASPSSSRAGTSSATPSPPNCTAATLPGNPDPLQQRDRISQQIACTCTTALISFACSALSRAIRPCQSDRFHYLDTISCNQYCSSCATDKRRRVRRASAGWINTMASRRSSPALPKTAAGFSRI
jgi:transketolase